jgi:hypothetical protein
MVMKWGFLLLLSSAIILTGCSGQTLFSANFDDGAEVPAALTLINAYAGVVDEDNALRLLVNNEVRGQTGEMLLPIDSSITDYGIRSRVRIHSGELRVWVRADQSACNGYVLSVNPTLDSYRISVAENCNLRTLRSTLQIDIRNDEWIDVRLEVRGTRIQAFINDAQFFDVEDSTYSAGLPLIQIVNDSTIVAQAELDQISVQQ